MKTEIWKAHPEYAGIEVSTLGRVRTLDKAVPCRGNGTRLVKGRVLKQRGTNNGYLQVHFKVDGKDVHKYVHRLVAQTFILNPNNFPEVNHLDCNRKNNNVSNLEWCSNAYNNWYRVKFGKSQGVPVLAVNLKTLEVSKFPSQSEAGRELGVYQPNITRVIKGNLNQTHGYWFVNDDNKATDAIKNKLHKIC